MRVDGVVKIPWRLEDEADQASGVQAGEIKKKPRSEGSESKEKQEEERRQRGPQKREKGREYQPRGWGYKGSSSYHYPY